MTKIIFAFFLIAVLLTGTIVPASFAQTPGLDRIRVVAADGEELDNALANGCKLVREAGPLNGVICNPRIAESLGLRADIKLHAHELGANLQIGATSVQNNNNTGVGAKVAIIDTGYNYIHEQLSGSSYLGGSDYVNNDDDPLDDNGHGSHVAGIVTSNSGNSIGVAPSTGVYAYKVLDENGSGSFTDVLAALQDIVWGPDSTFGTGDDNSVNVDAINLSLGSGKPYVYKSTCDDLEPQMTSIIEQARSIGIAVVISAGNEGKGGVSFPGCISHAITVAAVDSSDKHPRFSSVGTAVDIAAPGVSIYSTTLGTNSYASWSGTSMAAPMITGTIALIKSADNTLSVNDIESALFGTAIDLGSPGFDSDYGYGRVSAIQAVGSLGPVNDPPTITITSPTGTTFANDVLITFSATATDTEDGSLAFIQWSSDVDGSIGTGTSIQIILTDNAVHTITAQVTDLDGKTSSDSVTITVGTPSEPPSSAAETANIDYKLRNGPNGGLIVTVTLLDGADAPVTVTPLTVELLHDGTSLGIVDHTTNGEGKAGFRLPNPVKSGVYETVILQVDGIDWNGTTNGAIFTK